MGTNTRQRFQLHLRQRQRRQGRHPTAAGASVGDQRLTLAICSLTLVDRISLLQRVSTNSCRYIDEFREDMRLLGCLPPSAEPRATQHIDSMVSTISHIIDNGHAYAADGDVFFDIATLPGYGRLSRHTQASIAAAPYTGRASRFRLLCPH